MPVSNWVTLSTKITVSLLGRSVHSVHLATDMYCTAGCKVMETVILLGSLTFIISLSEM